MSRAVIAVFGVLFFQAWGANSSWSQVPTAPQTPQAAARLAKFDTLLTDKQYTQLVWELKQVRTLPDAVENMLWQQARLNAGASAVLGFSYASDLWRVATSMPNDTGREVKKSALTYLLYTYELIALDGVKCEDSSAPARHRDQLFSIFPEVWSFGATLAEAERNLTVGLALHLEGLTAPKRSDDEFICLDEAARTNAMVRKNAWIVEKSASNAGPVKPADIPAELDYKPKFVSREVWLPKQAALRQAMQGSLNQIMDRFKTPAGK